MATLPKGVVGNTTTQAQFNADRAFQEWSQSQKGYIGKEKKAEMQKYFSDVAFGRPTKVPSYAQSYVKQQSARLDAIRPPQPMQSGTAVQQGDTLGAIAKRSGVSVDQLMAANPNITDPNKIKAGMQLNIPTAQPAQQAVQQAPQATATAQPEQPGIWESIKGAVGSAGGATKSFLQDYGGLAGGAAQGLAAYKGYEAGQESREKVQKLLEGQLAETKATDVGLQSIKYDPTRYAQEQQFRQERIAGGGITPVEQQMQREADLRSAKMAAAARLSGMEQMARMGGGAAGAGSALAASLAGAQGLAGTQAQANLAREAAASQRLEQDMMRAGALKSLGTQEEASLAAQQAQIGLQRAQQAGQTVGQMAEQQLIGGAAQANLYGRLADLATAGIAKVAPPPKTELEKAQESAALAEAKAREQKALQDLQTKAAAAQQKGSTPPVNVSNQPQNVPKTSAASSFNTQYNPNAIVNNLPQGMQGAANKMLNQGQQALQQQGQKMVSSATQQAGQAVQNMAGKVTQNLPKPVQNVANKAVQSGMTAATNLAKKFNPWG